MLQRIQTIWLLLAAICAFLGYSFLFTWAQIKKISRPNFKRHRNIPLILSPRTVGVLAFIAIFLYKNRKLQLRLCIAGIVLQALLFSLLLQAEELYRRHICTHSFITGWQLLFFFLAAGASATMKK